MSKKQLAWGQTPWDDLDRDELLREVQRMASALQSANSVLSMISAAEPAHPFWTRGTGARAAAKVEQALARLTEYDGENIYRSFYRYADDLLFDSTTMRIGWGWAVCPVCDQMIGEGIDEQSAVGTTCASHLNTKCPGVLRAITWDDLTPRGETA